MTQSATAILPNQQSRTHRQTQGVEAQQHRRVAPGEPAGENEHRHDQPPIARPPQGGLSPGQHDHAGQQQQDPQTKVHTPRGGPQQSVAHHAQSQRREQRAHSDVRTRVCHKQMPCFSWLRCEWIQTPAGTIGRPATALSVSWQGNPAASRRRQGRRNRREHSRNGRQTARTDWCRINHGHSQFARL